MVEILIIDPTSPAGFIGSSISIRTLIKMPQKLELQIEKSQLEKRRLERPGSTHQMTTNSSHVPSPLASHNNLKSSAVFERDCRMSENYYTIRSLKGSLKGCLSSSKVVGVLEPMRVLELSTDGREPS